ncbi:LLM class flavin-dependent oxidoreductase [Brevibacterium sp. SMBL_HHYL_HB1]|uniref:LLM class flavin-dependent oxidoreductase n=1 Tax=Brevibacterium sp. SMBL_HHYL_HB1 TaxID=2777556 RepID=UPI001BA82D4E|nr:LLM class flavin-dependent oxidoreductase [Brevibacterium sp. SMBL_HHYL_HB1]QUL79223.1 LLM class flavin-dependent oxidoreductase [Brevibacterium sp. SMBL_HHYL_HB1]
MSVLIATTLTPDLRTGPAAAKTLDGHADFALVPDGFDGLDGLEFASWLGPLTTHLGLVPEVRVTHLEPFHTATASATLDYAARSRAGLAVGISHTAAEAELFGRREPAPALAAWAEAGAIIDVIRRLWDSWDDDAIIRDQATGRYIDRDRLHRVGAQLEDSTGTEYSVLGPSITPRPPQGHPPIAVRAEPGNEAARAAADIVLVDEAAGEISLEDLRSGLDPAVAVLTVLPAPRTRAEVAELVGSVRILTGRGASGILLSVPADEQLEISVRLVSEILPALQAAGLRETPAQLAPAQPDLRTRLGLGPAESLYAQA